MVSADRLRLARPGEALLAARFSPPRLVPSLSRAAARAESRGARRLESSHTAAFTICPQAIRPSRKCTLVIGRAGYHFGDYRKLELPHSLSVAGGRESLINPLVRAEWNYSVLIALVAMRAAISAFLVGKHG